MSTNSGKRDEKIPVQPSGNSFLVDCLIMALPILQSVFSTVNDPNEKNDLKTTPLTRWSAIDEREQVPDRMLSYSGFDSILKVPLINGEYDLIFVKCLILITALLAPLFVCCFMYDLPWYYGLLYAILEIRLKGTFISLMHCSSHTPIFKKSWWPLNYYVPVLGILLGQPPYTYQMHHLKMHHVENNGLNDLSSTLLYDRDSILGFLHYYFRFLFFIIFELTYYFVVTKRQLKHALTSLAGELSYYFIAYQLWQINPVMTIFTMFIPFNTSRFGMMSGNWGQHALIDRASPLSDWGSSITVSNNHYNKESFMDGYHTSHHLNPRRHWRDHRRYMLDNETRFIKKGALIFEGIDFHGVWFYLMTKNYSKLADHVVYIDGEQPDKAIVMAKLKARARKFTKEELTP
mmetsp:Transcript_13057/g.14471  ORF Transcript_13057/g.14471 Transcript_13057/m.14471 type:complete len:404 (+) Transcript_13057:96-1307(+)